MVLIQRKIDEFPHDIGLFLGYPPEDVLGFITNKAYTLSSSQVSLAKRAAEFIAANRDEQITVSMLSKRFNVSITHLQNAFKGVFGVTV